MRPVRLLAFSDLHRDRTVAEAVVRASADAEVVVGAGDFGTRGQGERDTLEVLARLVCPLVLVSGNHDRRTEIDAWCGEKPADRHLLHGSAVRIAGATFLGIGGEVPRIGRAPWNESIEEAEAVRLLARAPSCDVLVSHTPPLGHADRQSDGSHEGSSAVLAAVRRDGPRLCLCGHIHHSQGVRVTVGRTLVHNLGPTLQWHVLESNL